MLTPPRARPGAEEFCDNAHSIGRCGRWIVGWPVRTNQRPPLFGNTRMSTTLWVQISPTLRRHHKGTGRADCLEQCLHIGLGATNDPAKRAQAGMDDDGLADLYSARTKRLRQRVNR